MGLPESGTRACDRQARQRLGRARSSVFWAPPRAVLAAETHPEAVALCRSRSAPGLSVQAWHIVARITEVDRWMTPARQRRVVEVHPDALDALAAAWSAARHRAGAAEVLGGDRDGRGLRMEIRV